jgi:predicted dienelactone hydrolase
VPDLDLALILCALGGGVYPLLGRTLSRPLRGFFLAIAAAVLAGQLYIVGPHWQIFPAYLAFALMIYVVWNHQPGRRYRLIALAADTLCILTLALLWILPVFSLPQPTGEYSVGTTGPISWVDTRRNLQGEVTPAGPRRELVVQIWYPAATGSRWGDQARYARRKELSLVHSYLAALRTNSVLNAPIAVQGAPYPVLLFGHRWAGTRTQNTFLVEDLASHGYVVVAVDHPLNSGRVQLADGTVIRSDRADALGNLESTTASAVMATWGKELGIWQADDQFALDKLQSGNQQSFSGRLDMTHVGAFGHSFGGAAATNLLGVDPRIKAAANLDGWTFQGLDHRTTQPLLIVNEGTAALPHQEIGVEGALDTADTAAVNGSLTKYGGYRAYVGGAQHLDFTDQTLYSPFRSLTFTGPIQGERIREITRGLVLGFFNQTLLGKGKIPTYPEVKMEHWPESPSAK